MTTNTMLNTNNQTITTGTTGSFGRLANNGTIVAGAVTTNAPICILTTPSLTTGAGSGYTFTLTNSYITSSSVMLGFGVYGQGTSAHRAACTFLLSPSNGSASITIYNNTSGSFNGTIVLAIHVL